MKKLNACEWKDYKKIVLPDIFSIKKTKNSQCKLCGLIHSTNLFQCLNCGLVTCTSQVVTEKGKIFHIQLQYTGDYSNCGVCIPFEESPLTKIKVKCIKN